MRFTPADEKPCGHTVSCPNCDGRGDVDRDGLGAQKCTECWGTGQVASTPGSCGQCDSEGDRAYDASKGN